MANDLTQNPLYVDTTAAVRIGPCRLRAIKHVASGASTVTVTDTTSGHVLWKSVFGAAGQTPLDELKLSVKGGVTVTVTAAGEVLVYLDDGER